MNSISIALSEKEEEMAARGDWEERLQQATKAAQDGLAQLG